MDVSAVAPFTNVACPTCGKHTRVKREFGPYTLTRRHAVGGMSMVFVAQDNTLDREVALKILSEEFSADERRIAAFEEEARLTASLSHPHIVRVLTTGRAFGRFYIAMEFVSGGHFERQIRDRGKIPEDEMLPIAIEVAEGLQAAHAAGLIHRDVKPGNILLDAEGHAKLVDFGLALVTHGGTATATELWATPYYVPPETIEGQAEDFRSDMYAFGATLYHALSGVPSCDQETMATDVLRDAKRRVKPLEDVDDTLSAETCEVVNKTMAYSPDDRFSSYADLISRLQTSLAHLKAGTARPAESKSALRAAKKRRERKAMILGGACVLVFVAGAAWLAGRKPADNPPPASETAAQPEVVAPPEIDDTSSAIARNYREARTAVEAGDYETAARLFLELHHNPEVQEPTRTWAGVEATLAGYLQGDPSAGRRAARETVDHTTTLADGTPGVGSEITGVLRNTLGLPALPPVSEGSGATRIVGNMIAGLKNWQQGMLDRAAECFTAAAGATPGEGGDWLAVYQRIAGDYLHDHAKLTAPVFAKLPEDPDSCATARDELDAMLVTLRTHGRAKFNVRAWQLDIARHAKLMKEDSLQAPPPSPSTADELLEAIARLSDEYRFGEVVKRLKSGESEALATRTRSSMLVAHESALVFLSDLENDLRESMVRCELTLRDGTEVATVSSPEPGKLRATLADGSTKDCGWNDFPPDSLITLHRQLVKSPASELERLRRHECAIAFDWLAGNRERAVAAAATLSQGSSSFKQRWESMSAGLPR